MDAFAWIIAALGLASLVGGFRSFCVMVADTATGLRRLILRRFPSLAPAAVREAEAQPVESRRTRRATHVAL